MRSMPDELTPAMTEVLEGAAQFDEGGYLGQETAPETYRKLLNAYPAVAEPLALGTQEMVYRHCANIIRELGTSMSPGALAAAIDRNVGSFVANMASKEEMMTAFAGLLDLFDENGALNCSAEYQAEMIANARATLNKKS